MALRLRKGKNDPKEVQLLFDLHELLNHGGEHWIKGLYRKVVKGKGMCYCLEGGAMKVAGRSDKMFYRLFDLLAAAIRQETKNRHYSIVGFNDSLRTEWKDVENVIRQAIKIGREEAA